MINKISPSTNTRLWQIDVLIGKLLTKCLSKPVKLNLDRLNILKKTSNNKKLLDIIRKNGFRLLLSTAAKMVGAYMACLIFKKVKKRKSHSSNHVMTNFLIHLLDYS